MRAVSRFYQILLGRLREEQCVSLQEHVWGTDGLARLEAIKAKVDPHSLFQCQKCVGFKGPVRDQ